MKKPSPKKKSKQHVTAQVRSAGSGKYVQIKRALENPKYRYRTIEGVIKETHVTFHDLNKVLSEHPEEFVVLHRKSSDGQKLITTRKHYKEKASLQEKVMGAVLNRVY